MFYKASFLVCFVYFCFTFIALLNGQLYEKDISIRVRNIKEANSKITVEENENVKLMIICHDGEEKKLLTIWKTICVRIISPSNDFEVFQGENESVVVRQYNNALGIFNFLPWQSNRIDLPIYNKTCIGVQSTRRYMVIWETNYIDFWKVLKLAIGLSLFFFAPYLSSNILFYYSSGVVLGIFASLLILIFVLSRFVPKRVGALSILFGGWAVVLYAMQLLISNLKTVVIQYQSYVLVYVLTVGFISFAICYKQTNINDVRTQNLIKWTLQTVALLFVFLSTDWSEAGISIIMILLIIYNFPASWTAKIRTYWRRKFPPKIKLLTEEEYHHQAAVETRKSLEQLRNYCNSPSCTSWKLMRRLKSPMRFAEFVEGESHLTDDEMLNYETEVSFNSNDDVEFTDDDSDDETARYRSNGTARLL